MYLSLRNQRADASVEFAAHGNALDWTFQKCNRKIQIYYFLCLYNLCSRRKLNLAETCSGPVKKGEK